MFGPEYVKIVILKRPDSGNLLPVNFENVDFRTPSDIFPQTSPNQFKKVPRPLPDTSQDIPKMTKKITPDRPKSDLGEAGIEPVASRFQVPGPLH